MPWLAALLIAIWETETYRSRTQVQPENLTSVLARSDQSFWVALPCKQYLLIPPPFYFTKLQISTTLMNKNNKINTLFVQLFGVKFTLISFKFIFQKCITCFYINIKKKSFHFHFHSYSSHTHAFLGIIIFCIMMKY